MIKNLLTLRKFRFTTAASAPCREQIQQKEEERYNLVMPNTLDRPQTRTKEQDPKQETRNLREWGM